MVFWEIFQNLRTVFSETNNKFVLNVNTSYWRKTNANVTEGKVFHLS